MLVSKTNIPFCGEAMAVRWAVVIWGNRMPGKMVVDCPEAVNTEAKKIRQAKIRGFFMRVTGD